MKNENTDVVTKLPLRLRSQWQKNFMDSQAKNIESTLSFTGEVTDCFRSEVKKIASYYSSRFKERNGISSPHDLVREKYFFAFNTMRKNILLPQPSLSQKFCETLIPVKDIGLLTLDKGFDFVPEPKLVLLPSSKDPFDVDGISLQITSCFDGFHQDYKIMLADVYIGFAFFSALCEIILKERSLNWYGIDKIVIAGTVGMHRYLYAPCIFAIDNLSSVPRMRPIGLHKCLKNSMLLMI